jgi:tetratricopeptide (TPR) repeat protein
LGRRGELEEAEELTRRATRLDPTQAWYFNNHGNWLVALRRFKEAETAFHEAISLDDTHVMARAGLADLLVTQNRRKEAREVCEAALAIDPKRLDWRAAPGLVNVGAALCDELREYEQGIVAFHRALELDPSDSEARRNAKGNLAVAYNNIAIAHMKKGQFEEAAEALQEGIAAHPTAQAHGNRAWLLLNVGRFDEAILEARKALALDPEYAMARANLDTAYVKLYGKLASLKQEVENDPADVSRTLAGWKRDPGPDLTKKQKKLWAEFDALKKRAEAAK